MKRLLACLTVMVFVTCCPVARAAQPQVLAATENVQTSTSTTDIPPVKQPRKGIHKVFKEKFIEGHVSIMSLIAIAWILGLTLCIERIIYLCLSQINVRKLLDKIDGALDRGDVESAKALCRNTRGPVASICYQGLMRIDDGIDVVEHSVDTYSNVQKGYLLKGCLWIKLSIKAAFIVGVLGAFINLLQAFEAMLREGDVTAIQIVAALKVALIPFIFGCIVALVLKVFYSYVRSTIASLITQMADSSISLLDMIMTYNLKYKK